MTNASKSGLQADCSLLVLHLAGTGAGKYLTSFGAPTMLHEKGGNPMDRSLTQDEEEQPLQNKGAFIDGVPVFFLLAAVTISALSCPL